MSLGLGVLVIEAGLSWWIAPLLSGLVFAGSVEFILIGLLAAGEPLTTIALTTLFTNSRHIFYGLTYPLNRIQSWGGKLYGIYSLTDEAYALASANPKRYQSPTLLLIMAGGLHLSWATGSLVGAVLASYLFADIPGLDFVLVGLFAVLSIDVFRNNRDYIALATAIGCGVLAMFFLPQHMIVAAMSGYVVLLITRHNISNQREH